MTDDNYICPIDGSLMNPSVLADYTKSTSEYSCRSCSFRYSTTDSATVDEQALGFVRGLVAEHGALLREKRIYLERFYGKKFDLETRIRMIQQRAKGDFIQEAKCGSIPKIIQYGTDYDHSGNT
ncbi:MAG: hypothetical protein A2912_01265 [Candidatus Buchananbacteria bacterium RIFCSPLOWO2_01_FULL_40_23b]|uniref:Uncharacterized protein n=1 Tax=Candidatus Buchananbacteria bacterium RIFCSPLOWO2_01_FULL_40_23b TaxID=1797544 RepID=A0A1G1YTP0_9BACT|nr:MAG: hypothetical protein A2912_01265 [Candidatus Buchananbacteria bacterium RIFCSPLOWO2_01_FULL_40_23b]